MRPQIAPLPGVVPPEAEQLEDLGWNDMGQEDAGHDGADTSKVVSITASSAPFVPEAVADTLDANSPLVHRQQRRLAERILADNPLVEAASIDPAHLANHEPLQSPAPAPAPANQQAPQSPLVAPKKLKPAAKKSPSKSSVKTVGGESGKQARRAAFTLRLDTDRHLKLRLAATMQGMSAQALVTEALDAMLGDIDDLDALAERFNTKLRHN
jgi:hypothetical protein